MKEREWEGAAKKNKNTWLTPQKKITLLCWVFAQYGEIKANTVNVYFGLIFGYFSALRTKRENCAKLSEPKEVQLNPSCKKNPLHSHKQ